jgi:pimeloyl-ACP methyl ester carboxylesterase
MAELRAALSWRGMLETERTEWSCLETFFVIWKYKPTENSLACAGVNMELAVQHWPAQKNEIEKIVLLHGMGGTGALWRPIAASLEEEYSILAPDQRGHGKSQIPYIAGARSEPKYTPLEYGRDIIDTMGARGFHPAWIIGHSMGVRSACAAAHLKPEWVKGLILIDLGFSGPAGGGLGDTLATFLNVLPMHFESRAAARAFMEQNCPDPAIAQYLMAVSVQTPSGLTFPFDKGALIQMIHAARDASVRTWVRSLAERGMPILVLRGATSTVWSHDQFLQEKESFKDCPSVEFIEMEKTGHGLPFERRVEFVALVKKKVSGYFFSTEKK